MYYAANENDQKQRTEEFRCFIKYSENVLDIQDTAKATVTQIELTPSLSCAKELI